MCQLRGREGGGGGGDYLSACGIKKMYKKCSVYIYEWVTFLCWWMCLVDSVQGVFEAEEELTANLCWFLCFCFIPPHLSKLSEWIIIIVSFSGWPQVLQHS